MAKLLSGKVGVQTYAGLSTSRNQIVGGQPTFIGLNETEPNLGLSPQNDYVLYGDANGARRWGEPQGSPSGTVSGISIRDEGLTQVGLAGSITIIDIVGDGIVAIQTHVTQGGVQVGLATLTVPANNLDAQSGSGFLEVSGISTIRVGAGLTIFAPSGTTGIASIGNITDANIDIYDDRSYLSIPNVAQLQAGVGLSVTSPATNRAKFDVTGNIPRLNVSGITTLTQVGATDLNASGIITATTFDGNLEGNVTGNVTGNLQGTVTGNVTGNVTGDVYAGLVTATRGITGNINSAGVSTVSQLLVTTINNTGFETAFGYIANGNSFMGNLNSGGISTTKYLQNTNINSTGIITATSFVGPVTGNIVGNLTGTIQTAAQPNITSLGTLTSVTVSGNVNANGNIVGDNATNITGIAGVTASTFTGTLQTAAQTNVTSLGTLSALTVSGDINANGNIVGDTATNISGISSVTALSFFGNGANLTNLVASSVLVTATNTTNATHYVTFSDSVSGQETMRSDIALTFNPSTDTLSCSTFAGNLTGSATGLTGSPDITVNDITCHNILPKAHNTYSLGSNAVRFAQIYAADMHFSNKNATPNSVDGTTGDWTLQEGENDIYMINNTTGKKYKINLTEV